MKLVTSFDCPPIPVRSFDWSAYEEEQMGGICSDPTCSCRDHLIIGHGSTEEDAVKDFVQSLLEHFDISVSELMTPDCEKCGKRPATHTALVREEMLSDERGTVWGHVEVQLCDECDRESEPDWDAIREEREEWRRENI